MFHSYVSKLPFVKDNFDLNSGRRMEMSCGYIRKAGMDNEGFRAYELFNSATGVRYRTHPDGLIVEYPEDYELGRMFFPNTSDLRYIPFATSATVQETNAFLTFCGRMIVDHKRGKSALEKWMELDFPPRRLWLVGAVMVVYAAVTLFVLIAG